MLVGLAALAGAFKGPEAVSNYAATVKVETIVQNTINSITKIINNNINTNSNTINILIKEQAKLIKALPNPTEFKQAIANTPQSVLTGLGLAIPKDEFQSLLDKAKTKSEIKDAVKKNMPDLILFDDIKGKIDDVKDFDNGR